MWSLQKNKIIKDYRQRVVFLTAMRQLISKKKSSKITGNGFKITGNVSFFFLFD